MPVRKRMALFIASLASLLLLINFHLEPPVEPVRAPVEVQGPHMAYDDSSQPLTGDPTDTIRETGHERPGAQVINFTRTGTDFRPGAHEQTTFEVYTTRRRKLEGHNAKPGLQSLLPVIALKGWG